MFNALDETTISETNIRDTVTRGYEQTDASSPGVSDVGLFRDDFAGEGGGGLAQFRLLVAVLAGSCSWAETETIPLRRTMLW